MCGEKCNLLRREIEGKRRGKKKQEDEEKKEDRRKWQKDADFHPRLSKSRPPLLQATFRFRGLSGRTPIRVWAGIDLTFDISRPEIDDLAG